MSRLVPSRLTALQGVLLLVAAVLGAAVIPRFAPVEPDLVLPVVVAGGLRAGRSTGALLGLAGGWMVDAIPPGTGALGLSALTYAAAGALAGSLHESKRHSPLLPGLAVLGAALMVWVVRLLSELLAGMPLDLARAGLSALATTLIGALLVPPLLHWEQRLVHRGRD